MGYVMMTVQNWKFEKADRIFSDAAVKQEAVSEFCKSFNLAAQDVDADYGLIPLQPGHFVFMLKEEAAEKLVADHPQQIQGPWSNSRISPS